MPCGHGVEGIKADGLDYKMIFKFGKYVERLLSASSIYICELVGARPLHLAAQDRSVA